MKYRLGLYEKSMPDSLTLEEKLTVCRAAGFDFLEISIDETDQKQERLDMSPSARSSIVTQCINSGVFIESMCLSAHRKYPLGSRDDDVRRQSVDILKKAVVFARDIGVRIIQLAGYDEYYQPSDEVTAANFCAGLRECVDFAAQYGVPLAFETMETPFMNTVAKAMMYVTRTASPYLGIYPDTGNITNSGVSVVDDILCGSGRIFAAHLKETRPNVFREVEFGSGHVDFLAAATAYKKAGVRRFLAEMWHCGRRDWQHQIERAAVFLRRILDGVFE